MLKMYLQMKYWNFEIIQKNNKQEIDICIGPLLAITRNIMERNHKINQLWKLV